MLVVFYSLLFSSMSIFKATRLSHLSRQGVKPAFYFSASLEAFDDFSMVAGEFEVKKKCRGFLRKIAPPRRRHDVCASYGASDTQRASISLPELALFGSRLPLIMPMTPLCHFLETSGFHFERHRYAGVRRHALPLRAICLCFSPPESEARELDAMSPTAQEKHWRLPHNQGSWGVMMADVVTFWQPVEPLLELSQYIRWHIDALRDDKLILYSGWCHSW